MKFIIVQIPTIYSMLLTATMMSSNFQLYDYVKSVCKSESMFIHESNCLNRICMCCGSLLSSLYKCTLLTLISKDLQKLQMFQNSLSKTSKHTNTNIAPLILLLSRQIILFKIFLKVHKHCPSILQSILRLITGYTDYHHLAPNNVGLSSVLTGWSGAQN